MNDEPLDYGLPAFNEDSGVKDLELDDFEDGKPNVFDISPDRLKKKSQNFVDESIRDSDTNVGTLKDIRNKF